MHFDGTVTLGNVLTIAAFALAALAFGLKVDFDIKNIRAWIRAHAECNTAQIAALNEIRSSLDYLRGVSDAQKQRDEGTAHDYRKGRL